MASKEKPTTKICKYCKTEIPYDAKVCPSCRKKQPGGGFLKFLLAAFAVVILIAIVSGGKDKDETDSHKVGEVGTSKPTVSAGSPSAEQTKPTEEQATAPSTEPQKTEYHVGDILMDGDLKIVYMASGEYVPENQFLAPKDGKRYIFLRFAFENSSAKSDRTISSFSFDCYADGYAADTFYGGDEELSATLSAGRTTVGCVYFEVPTDAVEIDVEYEVNVFTNEKMHFVYEGELDSGYQPVLNTAATAGAHAVGDTIESSKLKVTYLSCSRYESTNMFIQPKEGYHFVTCEFEFENCGDSDEWISATSFDCYADGASCSQTYVRDDELSATLSAGRKCKGTVTFEVPDHASVVEAEYLSDIWTSSRLVFTVAE